MKKLLSVLLAAMMLLACTACGGSAGSSDENVTITFWSTPIMDEAEIQALVDEFEAAHENIDVDFEFQTWEGISEKLQIALSTGDTPDVYLDGAARTASLPSLDVLVPVDDIMESYDDWYESVMDFGVVDGTHYLVPASQMGASFININVTQAKELGVYDLLPEDRISWDIHDFYEFVKACSEAGADQGVKGTILYAGSSTSDDILYSLMLSNGGSIIDKETNTCVANSPECVEVIQVLVDIVQNGYCVDGATLLTGSDTGPIFYNEQSVSILNGNAPAQILEFQGLKEEGYIDEVPDIRTYGVPTAEGVVMDSACWGANGIAIFDNDDEAKIAASKEFTKFLMESSFAETVWNTSPNYYPSRDNGAEFSNESEAVVEEVLFRQELTTLYADYSFGILENYWSEVRNYFYPELQAAFSGEKTAQEAMDSFTAAVNQILANQ